MTIYRSVLAALVTVTVSTNVMAAPAIRLHPLAVATHAGVEAFRKFAAQAEKNSKRGEGTVSSAYAIDPVSKHKEGETRNQMIERLVKYSLHRDYPITGNDGGYSFQRLSSSATAADIERSANRFQALDGRKLKALLAKLVHAQLLVLSGTGSGNNTSADILVVSDPKNMQFVILMNSNFGSDN